jgi:hypothetical protein
MARKRKPITPEQLTAARGWLVFFLERGVGQGTSPAWSKLIRMTIRRTVGWLTSSNPASSKT